MHISKELTKPTTTTLTITADKSQLAATKEFIVTSMSRDVKVPGFRPGKAPAHLIEKQIDQSLLQTEFLERAVNDLYVAAVREEKLRPVAQPNITINKFVPFDQLEFKVEVETVGEIKLPDYKKIKLSASTVSVTAKDVTEVLNNVQTRAATKQAVTRAAKDGDEVVIDFFGTDAKTKEPISGADGKDYPLLLGSGSFIPGFEEQILGLKADDTKDFLITFPADYGVKALQSRKVNFAVTVHEVKELVKAKLDDTFAGTVGPFKNLAELKDDIKRQLQVEREQEAARKFDNELLEKIAEQTEVAIPKVLVDEEIERIEEEEKRNVAYRGQTWQEHLDEEGLTAEGHKEKNRPGAELRVKAGLILGDIAEAEDIQVSQDDLEARLTVLKSQYSDLKMQAELDKPENRRDVASRLVTEKTLDKLRTYATAK